MIQSTSQLENRRKRGQPLGISSTPFHGVSVNNKLLNVMLMFGCFFFIRSRASVGSWKGNMTSSSSGLDSVPPPMLGREEAILARREEAIADANEERRVWVNE